MLRALCLLCGRQRLRPHHRVARLRPRLRRGVYLRGVYLRGGGRPLPRLLLLHELVVLLLLLLVLPQLGLNVQPMRGLLLELALRTQQTQKLSPATTMPLAC